MYFTRFAFVIFFCFSLSAQPAGQPPTSTLHGEVVYENSPGNRSVEAMVVRLKPLDRAGPARESQLTLHGGFEFRDVPAGSYQVTVENGSGGVLRSDVVSVNAYTGPLTLRIQGDPVAARPGGVVSLRQLAHKVPKRARKEFELAGNALARNDTRACIVHLEKAVSLDPLFVQARNNLALRYMLIGEFEKSEQHFAAALAEDPACVECQANYAILLLSLGRPAEAERAAQRAVSLNGLSAKSHYVLALALLRQNKVNDDLLRHLEVGKEEVPHAHLVLAQLKIAAGRGQEAAAHLEQYLSSGRSEHREQVQAWLRGLRRGPAAPQTEPR